MQHRFPKLVRTRCCLSEICEVLPRATSLPKIGVHQVLCGQKLESASLCSTASQNWCAPGVVQTKIWMLSRLQHHFLNLVCTRCCAAKNWKVLLPAAFRSKELELEVLGMSQSANRASPHACCSSSNNNKSII
jgi:hypothetical protein